MRIPLKRGVDFFHPDSRRAAPCEPVRVGVVVPVPGVAEAVALRHRSHKG
ncbi:MAG: hypothetical protein MZU79_01830 [Anaerotruncus sp.]|nr:hypothetical protein [Anaerotruncus sp.]